MDIVDINMDEQDEKIIRIIKRIKNDRNRACLQNILSFANREENKMELKTIVDKLVALDVFIDAGVNGKKSFPHAHKQNQKMASKILKILKHSSTQVFIKRLAIKLKTKYNTS